MKHKFILRIPRFSFNDFKSKIENREDEFFSKLLDDNDFMQAIELASPSFYSYIMSNDIEKNEKAKKTILEYFSRSSVRCIPFGGFAGLGILDDCGRNVCVQKNSEIKIKGYEYTSCLNTEVASKIAETLMSDNKLRHFFSYTSNSGLFFITTEKYRYIKHYLSEINFYFELTEFEVNEILDTVIAFCLDKRSYVDILKLITKEGFQKRDSEEFINLLIDNKILISELELTTVGKALEYQLLDTIKMALKNYHSDILEEYKKLLENIIDLMSKNVSSSQLRSRLDNTILKKLIDKNRPIISKDLHIIFDGTFEEQQVKAIEESAYIFGLFLTKRTGKNRLRKFKENFEEKYGSSSISLCEALDPDVGINYDPNTNVLKNNKDSDLVQGFPQKEDFSHSEKININYIDEFLLKKISLTKGNVVNISEEEVADLKKAQNMLFGFPKRSPMSVVRFSFFTDKKNYNNIVHIKSISDTSPNRLIGRFTQKNLRFFELAKEVAEYEDNEKNNENIIHAEVDYKSNLNSNNIINRNEIRRTKITYFSCNNSSDIRVGDLLLSLEGGEFVIRSKKTKERVIPHFSSAFDEDFAYSLPIFKFLLDIENQYNIKEELIDTKKYHRIFFHIPRIVYKNTILHPESWLFSISNFKENKKNEFDFSKYKKILLKLGIPRFFYIVHGDRELVIDQENPFLMKIFFDELKDKKELYLEECLLNHFNSIIVDEKKNRYNNDIFLFTKNEPIKYTNLLEDIKNESSIPKVFMPGSEWLYFKIYAEEIFVEKILRLLVSPIEKFIKQRVIKNYHFVKYIDEGYHLRIRFQISSVAKIHLVFNAIIELLSPYQDTYISNVVVDSYKRELDRYGRDNIPIIENIFTKDSSFVLGIISNDKLPKRWLYGLVGIDIYCNSLELDLNEKIEFCRKHELWFIDEFHANTETYKFINKKYIEHKGDIIELFNNYSKLPFSQNLLKYEIKKELAKVKLSKMNKIDILSSLIHMHIIRLVGPWNNRKIEFMLYSFCLKYYNYLRFKR